MLLSAVGKDFFVIEVDERVMVIRKYYSWNNMHAHLLGVLTVGLRMFR